MNKLSVFPLVLLLGCGGDESNNPPITLPEVETTGISAITGSSAMGGGNITSTGGGPIWGRGVVYGEVPNPVLMDIGQPNPNLFAAVPADIPSGGAGAGSFDLSLEGLSAGTTYYVRAYASNNAGISYGEQVSFTTFIVDVDGNEYTQITIGTQVWLKENLTTSKYANGDAISQPGPDWGLLTTTVGGWCFYGNNSSIANPYGRLYNWYAVADSRGLCPTGWHVASDAEWTTLETFLGGSAVAGGKLKEAGTTHWLAPNTGADNSSGFTGLPGGNRRGADNSIFETFGTMGRFWTSTEVNSDAAFGRDLVNTGTQVGGGLSNQFNKRYGFSIRCIRD